MQFARATGDSFLLADQIQRILADFLAANGMAGGEADALRRLFRGCQEILFRGGSAYALLRPKIGQKRFIHVHPEMERLEEVDAAAYLEAKDAYAQGELLAARKGLHLDFSPFYEEFPKVAEPAEMGEGASFLHRSLSGKLHRHPEKFRAALLKFLRGCRVGQVDLFVNDHLASPALLDQELEAARSLLGEMAFDASVAEVYGALRGHGFEPGWGRTAGDIARNLAALARLLNSPDAARLEEFLGRLPLVRSAVLVSPHGWFAQEGVLGRPDTGGQVTYVLDQARALERQMRRRFEESGVDAAPAVAILTRLIPNADGTSCNVQREKVHGSDNCWIVRAPFRNANGEIHPDWISRFHVWPYLEDFAEESRGLVAMELGGPPDLVFGNYSDGNLVAHLLASGWGATHAALAHALEKTKYLFSDMRWYDMERDYHFSLQFTADIVSYNSADFILTSTYREIAGSETEMGMFESYETFSMPGLYRVLSGLDPRLARFNIAPPGASEECFFPNTEKTRRVPAMAKSLEERLLGPQPVGEAWGRLDNPDLPPIFAMSRVDKVKNLPGLVEAYGTSDSLRRSANLVIVSSILDPEKSGDQEEIDQLRHLRELIERHSLEGSVRWVAARLDKMETGEGYRVMADRGGVFAQPALMETFGLTVIEAMACGLPVVVTCFGGPAEIVVRGVSGEIENPNDLAAFASAMERTIADRDAWRSRAEEGIKRVRDAFSWPSHAEKALRLANVYSFWNALDAVNRKALDEYIHMLYHAVYRPRCEAMLTDEGIAG